MGSDLALEAIDAREVYAQEVNRMARHGDGSAMVLIGGRFSFDETQASVLLDALPTKPAPR